MKRAKTSSFLLEELPLSVLPAQARSVRAHLEAARLLSIALCWVRQGLASHACVTLPLGRPRVIFLALTRSNGRQPFLACAAGTVVLSMPYMSMPGEHVAAGSLSTSTRP